LSIEEACDYLKIPRSTLYKLAQEGKIPCQKVGRHWRFLTDAIDRWLEASYGRDEGQLGEKH
jgi:excisionase family DNA binding protein